MTDRPVSAAEAARRRTCARKTPHASLDAARGALCGILASRPTQPGDATLVVYRCRVSESVAGGIGPHWHVGHASGRQKRTLQRRAERRHRRERWRQVQADTAGG